MNAAVLNVAERQSTAMLDQFLRPTAPYLALDITDLCVNRPRELWVRDAAGWHRHEVPELSLQHCMSLASTIASYRKKPPMPILSATLPAGERVHVISPPACEPNTVSFSIRKPSNIERTLPDLDAGGAFAGFVDVGAGLQPFEHQLLSYKQARQILPFLDLAVRQRRNILIVGKTGSGKTTVTKALAGSVPPGERIVTIEDEHELFLPGHPNKVHLFYGREDEEGTHVTASQALAACLRMAPDRIWLAELRGPEAWEYIKSISTGHPGSIATMHANGAVEAFDQLAAHVKDSRTGAGLDIAYVRRRLVATIDIVLFFHDYKLQEVYYDPEAKRCALV
jgi:type IV secretion system protein VirB11